jgi:hypothetical protein
LLTCAFTEQETLIRTLHLENTIRNTQYARLLLALPLLSIVPYIPTLLATRTSFLSLLSISSLLSTAYLLYILPPGRTFIPLLDNLNAPAARSPSRSVHEARDDGGQGPIERYLPSLNLVLSAVLGVLGLVSRGKELAWWGFGWLPAAVYAVVLLAKVVMGSVDPEAELGSLRYEFKGA